ncbi:MAG: membrane protein insertase YidC [Actinomycetota bacterium]|nr:membrane protein insertase YidC [Actinomycetota bacterium]
MLVTANIFGPLISVFAAVIKFFHDTAGFSWGWSIVLLTVCVRLVLVPLSVKQFRSMRKLQHVQPQMKAIQQKYKDDKQRQQEEMMKFYRENEVNPFGSCLPLVAQFPVFISLYYMLRENLRKDICPPVQALYEKHYALLHHESLKAAATQTTACGSHYPSASFLFIHDITSIPTGLTLVVLLVLYVGTQIASTLLMSAPTMDRNQRNMMLLLPLAFVLFIIRFPAGLIVYWITTNTWTMVQQYTIKTLMGPAPAPVDAGDAGGSTGGGSTGGGLGGGLGGLLRGRGPRGPGSGGGVAPEAGGGGREDRAAAVPPRPPRKKKKRSGRRR